MTDPIGAADRAPRRPSATSGASTTWRSSWPTSTAPSASGATASACRWSSSCRSSRTGCTIAFLPVGESKVELVMPTDDTTGVARFLAAKGEGFHHVCFEVANLAETLMRLEIDGIELIDTRPAQGRRGAGRVPAPAVLPRGPGGADRGARRPVLGDAWAIRGDLTGRGRRAAAIVDRRHRQPATPRRPAAERLRHSQPGRQPQRRRPGARSRRARPGSSGPARERAVDGRDPDRAGPSDRSSRIRSSEAVHGLQPIIDARHARQPASSAGMIRAPDGRVRHPPRGQRSDAAGQPAPRRPGPPAGSGTTRSAARSRPAPRPSPRRRGSSAASRGRARSSGRGPGAAACSRRSGSTSQAPRPARCSGHHEAPVEDLEAAMEQERRRQRALEQGRLGERADAARAGWRRSPWREDRARAVAVAGRMGVGTRAGRAGGAAGDGRSDPPPRAVRRPRRRRRPRAPVGGAGERDDPPREVPDPGLLLARQQPQLLLEELDPAAGERVQLRVREHPCHRLDPVRVHALHDALDRGGRALELGPGVEEVDRRRPAPSRRGRPRRTGPATSGRARRPAAGGRRTGPGRRRPRCRRSTGRGRCRGRRPRRGPSGCSWRQAPSSFRLARGGRAAGDV